MSLEIANLQSEQTPGSLETGKGRLLLHHGLLIGTTLLRLITVRNIIIFSVAAAFTVILWVFVDYFAHLVFTKPQQVFKDSFSYSLFISEFVDELPAFKPLENSEEYYFNIISDSSVPVNIMRYQSHAPAEEIISYYRLYFEILNYTFIKQPLGSKAMAMFHNTHEGFTVFVATTENSNVVTIENFNLK